MKERNYTAKAGVIAQALGGGIATAFAMAAAMHASVWIAQPLRLAEVTGDTRGYAMSLLENINKDDKFIYDDGNGNGYGNGSGDGDGNGNGYGNGSGDGDGTGSGYMHGFEQVHGNAANDN